MSLHKESYFALYSQKQRINNVINKVIDDNIIKLSEFDFEQKYKTLQECVKSDFILYYYTYIQPLIMDRRNPIQVCYKSCILTINSFCDLRYLQMGGDFKGLKKKRAIRLIEEAERQDTNLDYKDMFYLLQFTKSPFYEMEKAFNKNFGIQLINKTKIKKDLVTRSAYIIDNIFIKQLNGRILSYEEISNNLRKLYSTWHEYLWICVEFVIVSMIQYFITKADNYRRLNDKLNLDITEDTVKQIESIKNMFKITDRLNEEYQNIYKKNYRTIGNSWREFFNKHNTISEDKMIKLILNHVYFITFNSNLVDIKFKRIRSYYKSLNFEIDDEDFIFKLKRSNYSKTMKPAKENLKECIITTMRNDNAILSNTSTNSRLIKERITKLKDVASQYDCNLTQLDICFILSISPKIIRFIK
jgi:hypothetical protein